VILTATFLAAGHDFAGRFSVWVIAAKAAPVILLLIVSAAAAAYQLLALVAALRHMLRKEQPPSSLPPISILKPVRGLDPHFREAIRSHVAQDYPDYEILFGAADPADTAVAEIRRLMKEFPERKIRLVCASSAAANGKVGVLTELAKEARYSLLLVNDSDIRVPPDYLRRIVGPLEDPGVGLVTCLYGARSDHWPGRWEAIGIATDFAPSVLVAPYAGVREFGLGSTLLFRREDLAAIGGFEAIADYIADDYQLARRITGLGCRAVLSGVSVETNLSGRTWGEVWRHQVRWARTIRVSRGGGYAGLPLANASLWALVAFVAGLWWLGASLVVLRMLVGLTVGAGILKRREVARHFYLMPFRDLWGLAVWVCGMFGNTVKWRGARLRLARDGKIVESS
jgi:ceramide glucosyltransferase